VTDQINTILDDKNKIRNGLMELDQQDVNFIRFLDEAEVVDNIISITYISYGAGFVYGIAKWGITPISQSTGTETLWQTILPTNEYLEGLSTTDYIDTANSTATITTNRVDFDSTNSILLSKNIVYNLSQPYHKVTFDFSAIDTDLDFKQGVGDTFPLTLPFTLGEYTDHLYISLDDGDTWIDISDTLTYEGEITNLKYKIVSDLGNKYLHCINPTNGSYSYISIKFE